MREGLCVNYFFLKFGGGKFVLMGKICSEVHRINFEYIIDSSSMSFCSCEKIAEYISIVLAWIIVNQVLILTQSLLKFLHFLFYFVFE